MEVAAIITVSARRRELESAGNDGQGNAVAEAFAQVPLALLDVVGTSVVQHTADRLRRAGVEAITALTEPSSQSAENDPLQETESHTGDAWRAMEEAFSAYASEGVETVLLLRLGAYAEFEIPDLLRFHLQRGQNATLICDGQGPLDAAVVQAARRNDAMFLLRNGLRLTRLPAEPYITSAYVNRLESARDLRRLAQDSLLQRCAIRPHGHELKPGVWVAEHARIHRSARVLAPAFVGAHAKVRAAAVVTRCSTVEHHAEVDCGTVLEDTSILPYTYVGPGLDAAHAVAGFGRVAHLRRHGEIEIADNRLLGTVTASPSWRMLKSAAALASYLPLQAIQGLLGSERRAARPTGAGAAELGPPLHAAALEPSPEPVPASNQAPHFSGDFAVVRRYGNE
jgi:NDP-sugar pyrophosphorylase family protein